MQGEVGEWVIRLLTGQQRRPLSDKALRSGIGRTMLQVSIRCWSGTVDHAICAQGRLMPGELRKEAKFVDFVLD